MCWTNTLPCIALTLILLSTKITVAKLGLIIRFLMMPTTIMFVDSFLIHIWKRRPCIYLLALPRLLWRSPVRFGYGIFKSSSVEPPLYQDFQSAVSQKVERCPRCPAAHADDRKSFVRLYRIAAQMCLFVMRANSCELMLVSSAHNNSPHLTEWTGCNRRSIEWEWMVAFCRGWTLLPPAGSNWVKSFKTSSKSIHKAYSRLLTEKMCM